MSSSTTDSVRPRTTKTAYFYRNGDPQHTPTKLPINLRKYRTIDALLDDLTTKVSGLPYGVRDLATAGGKHRVRNLAELEHMAR
jgi:hypothetical protein